MTALTGMEHSVQMEVIVSWSAASCNNTAASLVCLPARASFTFDTTEETEVREELEKNKTMTLGR